MENLEPLQRYIKWPLGEMEQIDDTQQEQLKIPVPA